MRHALSYQGRRRDEYDLLSTSSSSVRRITIIPASRGDYLPENSLVVHVDANASVTDAFSQRQSGKHFNLVERDSNYK